MMIRLTYIYLLFTVTLLLGGCRKEVYPAPTAPVDYTTPVLLPVTSVYGPYSGYVYEEIPIQVTYLVPENYAYVDFPGGGIFGAPEELYVLGVYGYEPVSAGPAPYYTTDTYYFTATSPGLYAIPFAQSAFGYLQHIISIY